eukprot:316452-Rhodomonas_salina.1
MAEIEIDGERGGRRKDAASGSSSATQQQSKLSRLSTDLDAWSTQPVNALPEQAARFLDELNCQIGGERGWRRTDAASAGSVQGDGNGVGRLSGADQRH